MLLIDVFANGKVVGRAELAHFDDGMGVAHGTFRPTSGYQGIREAVVSAAEARSSGEDCAAPKLQARSLEGELVQSAFVTIDDFGEAAEPEIAVQFSDRDQWLRVTGRA